MRLFLGFFILLTFQSAWGFDHSHTSFDKLLKKHVKYQGPQSLVDYKGIKKEIPKLDNYLASLSNISKKEFQKFDENQKLAFLINAYNAFTIKLILNHYPLKSIKDIGSFFNSPWKKKFFTLLGEEMHLDGIGDDILRENFKEPRIHFAINCASLSCPSLMPFAFMGKKLNKQLAQATKSFLANSQKNRYDKKTKKLLLSKIFKWYKKDFEKTHSSVREFVAPFLDIKKKEKLKIRYLDYDWGLNQWK